MRKQVSASFGAAGHGSARLLLLSWLYRVLAAVLSSSSPKVQQLVPRATHLALDTLQACFAATTAAQANNGNNNSHSNSNSSRKPTSSMHHVLEAIMPSFLAVVSATFDNQVSICAFLSA